MDTLGAAISALLRANGVPGPIARIEGGPHELTVMYYRLDSEGRKYIADDGKVAVGRARLNLSAPAGAPVEPGIVQTSDGVEHVGVLPASAAAPPEDDD